jgi:hypothetical protein
VSSERRKARPLVLAEGEEHISMAQESRPVSHEAQVEALRTLVAAVTASRDGDKPEAGLAPGLLDVLDGLEPRESALVSELLMSIAFRAGGQVSERYPFIEFAIHLGRAALGDSEDGADPARFLQSRLPDWDVMEPALRTMRRHGRRWWSRNSEGDPAELLQAYALGAAQLACLSHADQENGRLAASGLLFTAAAQILTLRKIEDPATWERDPDRD